jgi:hypothetical protein
VQRYIFPFTLIDIHSYLNSVPGPDVLQVRVTPDYNIYINIVRHPLLVTYRRVYPRYVVIVLFFVKTEASVAPNTKET